MGSQHLEKDPIPRQTLLVTSAACFFGSLLGLYFAYLNDALTLLFVGITSLLNLASIFAFYVLWISGHRYIDPLSRLILSLWGIQIVCSLANQIYLEPTDIEGSLLYTIWLPLYHLLAFIILDKRFAHSICWTVFAFTAVGHLFMYVSLSQGALIENYAVSISLVILISQPSIILLTSGLLQYRIRLELAGHNAVSMEQSNERLRTALEEAESAQRETQSARELLIKTIDSIHPGVVVFDKDGKLLLSNKSLRRSTEGLGIPMEQGISWAGLASQVAKAGAQDFEEEGGKTNWLESVTKMHSSGGGSNQFKLPDGRTFLVFERQWEDGTSVTTLTDVSELERNRETISQLQKMEALGRLTGGIAHDFNNFLSIILGNLEFIHIKLGADHELAHLVVKATKQTQKGAILIQQLLAFARGNKLKLRQVDPTVLVKDMLSITQSALSGHNKIELNMVEAGDQIEVESDLLQNMVINIVLNARDAMPHGGNFTIDIGPRKFAEGEAKGGLNGDYVGLDFTDTGEGIPADILPRVFEPFFTTKSVEQGSGLGLSMVYGLAKQFHGDVRIKSEVGVGTTVSLLFPLAKGKLGEDNEDRPQIGAPAFSGEALIVEDNEDMLAVSEQRLLKLGFAVTCAASYSEAQEKFGLKKFDLVFSDVVLPDGNGYDLVKTFRELDPQVRILITSGYTELKRSSTPGLEAEYPFLPKPHTHQDLLESLSELFK